MESLTVATARVLIGAPVEVTRVASSESLKWVSGVMTWVEAHPDIVSAKFRPTISLKYLDLIVKPQIILIGIGYRSNYGASVLFAKGKTSNL